MDKLKYVKEKTCKYCGKVTKTVSLKDSDFFCNLDCMDKYFLESRKTKA